jgi:hypothetical protein
VVSLFFEKIKCHVGKVGQELYTNQFLNQYFVKKKKKQKIKALVGTTTLALCNKNVVSNIFLFSFLIARVSHLFFFKKIKY